RAAEPLGRGEGTAAAGDVLRDEAACGNRRRAWTRSGGRAVGRRGAGGAGAPGRAQLRRAAGVVRAARAARGRARGEVGDAAPRGLLALRVRGPAAVRRARGRGAAGPAEPCGRSLGVLLLALRLGPGDAVPAGLAHG